MMKHLLCLKKIVEVHKCSRQPSITYKTLAAAKPTPSIPESSQIVEVRRQPSITFKTLAATKPTPCIPKASQVQGGAQITCETAACKFDAGFCKYKEPEPPTVIMRYLGYAKAGVSCLAGLITIYTFEAVKEVKRITQAQQAGQDKLVEQLRLDEQSHEKPEPIDDEDKVKQSKKQPAETSASRTPAETSASKTLITPQLSGKAEPIEDVKVGSSAAKTDDESEDDDSEDSDEGESDDEVKQSKKRPVETSASKTPGDKKAKLITPVADGDKLDSTPHPSKKACKSDKSKQETPKSTATPVTCQHL